MAVPGASLKTLDEVLAGVSRSHLVALKQFVASVTEALEVYEEWSVGEEDDAPPAIREEGCDGGR